MMNEDRLQPNDLHTEEAVIATLMRYNDLYKEYAERLDENLFYNNTLQVMFLCIKGVIESGGITDINSLYGFYQENSDTLGEKIYQKKLERLDFVQVFQKSSTKSFGQDVERLLNFSLRRTAWNKLVTASNRVLTLTDDFDDSVEEVCNALRKLQMTEGKDSVSTFNDAITDLNEIVHDNGNGKRIFLKTGFHLFDDFYLLRPSTMTIIAAFTSVGKSALAMNISVNVARGGDGVAYYSLEMNKAELASRAISKDAWIPASIIMNKPLEEWQKLTYNEAVKKNMDLPIYIDERSTVSFDKTISSIRMMAEKKNIKLAVIDYLQIYTQVSENTESSLAYMARAAKNIAKECNIAVILISQLNRSDSHPSIKMLRGSGQIEESADNIVLIDRPAAYPDNKVKNYEGEFEGASIEDTAKLMLVKGRGVGTGCSLVGFDGRYTTFFERTNQNEEKDPNKIELDTPF